jgi:hypothetical protein
MNIFLTFFLFVSLVLSPIPTIAALTNADRSEIPIRNSLIESANAGFENSKAGWTISGGDTFSISTTNVEFGSAKAVWDSAGAGRSLCTKLVNVPKSSNGFAYARIKTTSGTATHLLKVKDGATGVLHSSTITSSTSAFAISSGNFVFGTNGQAQVCIESVNANEPEIQLDDFYLGDAYNLTNVSQAYLFGTAIQDGATGGTCVYLENTSVSFANWVTLGSITAASGCNAWTTTGSVGVTGTNSHSITIASMPPGDYVFEFSGIFQSDTASQSCYYRIIDGTTGLSDVVAHYSLDSYTTSMGYIKGSYSVTSPLTAKTFSIQAVDDGAGVCRLNNGSTTASKITWKVYKYPNSSQQVAPNDATLKGWATFTPTGSWSGTTTYTGRYRQVGDSLEVEAKVALSGAPTGTNLDFNIPFSLSIDTAKLTEASGNNINIGTFNGYIGSLSTFNGTVAYQSSTSVRLYYQTTGGTPTNSITNTALTATAPGSFASGGQVIAKFKVPIVGWKSEVPVPILIGSVTSNSAGAERVERAYINCDASATVNSQSGSWISSVANRAQGCTLTLATGIFSATPSCSWTIHNNITNAYPIILPASATQVTVYGRQNDNSTYLDHDGYLICMGPK